MNWGRDGRGGGWVGGSCLRRNDGWGCGEGGKCGRGLAVGPEGGAGLAVLAEADDFHGAFGAADYVEHQLAEVPGAVAAQAALAVVGVRGGAIGHAAAAGLVALERFGFEAEVPLDVEFLLLAGLVVADLLSVFEQRAVAVAEAERAVLALSGEGSAAAAQASAAFAAIGFAVLADFAHARSRPFAASAGAAPAHAPSPTTDWKAGLERSDSKWSSVRAASA